MSISVKELVLHVVEYEPLGRMFVFNALMNEANRAIKHYAENGDTPGALVNAKLYAYIAEDVKQQLNKRLEENK